MRESGEVTNSTIKMSQLYPSANLQTESSPKLQVYSKRTPRRNVNRNYYKENLRNCLLLYGICVLGLGILIGPSFVHGKLKLLYYYFKLVKN